MYFTTYKCSITPPYPTKKAGHMDAIELINTNHDPIEARFIYLEKDNTKLLLISCDLLGLPYHFCQRIQTIVNQYFKHQVDLLLSCTHTHYSYDIENNDYLNTLAAIIENSLHNLKPKYYKTLSIGYQCIPFNEISSSRISYYHEEQIYLSLLNFYDNNNLLACIIIHNTHPTILSSKIPYFSSEFCGYTLQLLSKTYPNTFFTYLSGASGDISTRFKRKGQNYDEVIRISQILYTNIIKIIDDMHKDVIDQIKIVHDKIKATHDYSILPIKDSSNLSSRELISLEYGIKIRKKLAQQQHAYPFINISTLTINQYQFIFIPNEIFSAYLNALNLNKQMLISYTNGYEPYILPINFEYFCYEAFCDTSSDQTKLELYNYLKMIKMV